MWDYTGEGYSTHPLSRLLPGGLGCQIHGSLVLTGLSLSELLNIKWWHTRLWLLSLQGECAGCGSVEVSGVAGSNDKFELAEM